MKKRVALIYGGTGYEHEISVLGRNNFIRKLNAEKYDLLEIFIDKSGAWYLNAGDESYPTFPVRIYDKSGFLRAGRIIECDVAIPLLHGDGGEDGSIQGTLKLAGIRCAGEDTATSALLLDKINTKIIASSLGIPSAKFVALRGIEDVEKAENICKSTLDYPMFIKPSCLGSSYGASTVRDSAEFKAAYRAARELARDVIAEELIESKRELEVAFLRVGNKRVITPPGEIIIDGAYGFNEKYKKGTKTTPRACVDDQVMQTICEYTARLIEGIGVRSISRFDYFLTPSGIILNEINTMPGFTAASLYTAMLDAMGYNFDVLVEALIDGAV